MTTAPTYQPDTRRGWSWLPFIAGIVVGIAGFFALGAVLFQDDVSSALQDDSISTEVQANIEELGLDECYGLNRYGCQSANAFTMDRIQSIVGTPADDEGMQRGLQLFDRGLAVADELECAATTEQGREPCYLAESSMNAGVVMVREAAGLKN